MEQNDKLVLVYATFSSNEEAATVGEDLIKGRLAACVNIVPGMLSIYEWEGQLHRDAETVMIIKTRASLAEAVMAQVSARHSYDNPALLVLPVDGGAAPYLVWLRTQTSREAQAGS